MAPEARNINTTTLQQMNTSTRPRFRKLLLVIVMFSCASVDCFAQDFGLSFSYFLPKNGYFSTPISPFSIRGLGFDINRFFAVQTGASLYRMSGLNLKGLPFESKQPLAGPNFTILIPAELVFQLKASQVEFDIKGGGFFFYGFDQRLNYGNLDRAIRESHQWEVVNSDFSFDNHPGFGYYFGAELTVYVTSQVGVSLETNYYIGDAQFPLNGSYTGGNSSLETIDASFPDAKIDFTGLEFSIGLIFSSGNSKPPGRKRR
jgi:hypothetical protein